MGRSGRGGPGGRVPTAPASRPPKSGRTPLSQDAGEQLIHAIRIPLPGFSDLGTANVFVLRARPVTLIDTGPKFPGSFLYLEEKLAEAGLAASGIERIVVTHGHIDHFGLVGSIRKAAGRSIPCHIHAEDRWRVAAETYREDMFGEDAERIRAMVDMPPEEMRKIRERFALFRSFCDPVPDALPMEDGDVFDGEGYELRVVQTPGHTPGTCCLYETSTRSLFTGDHILGHITPNPIFELRKERLRDRRYQSLAAYTASLDRVERLDVRRVLPGHGEDVTDLPGLLAGYRVHHRERMDRIWRAIRDRPRPLYHLIGDVFDFVPEHDVFLAVSEILVHLEILENEGRAELADPGPPLLYRAL